MGFFDKIFGRNKKVQQKIEKTGLINPNDIWFTLPTVSNEFPETVETTKQTAFDIHIHDDDYRQNEFLNLSSLSLIEKEIESIKPIWENYSRKSDGYTIFKHCHTRSVIGAPDLTIPLDKLQELLKIDSIGQVLQPRTRNILAHLKRKR